MFFTKTGFWEPLAAASRSSSQAAAQLDRDGPLALLKRLPDAEELQVREREGGLLVWFFYLFLLVLVCFFFFWGGGGCLFLFVCFLFVCCFVFVFFGLFLFGCFLDFFFNLQHWNC